MASGNILSRSVKRLLASGSSVLNLNAKRSVWTSENIVKSPLKDIDLPNRTLVEHVWENLDRWADKTALVCAVTHRSLTYHQLFKYSKNFGAQLRSKFKISDGDVICIMMNNVPEYAIVVLGALEAGAEVTTVNPMYTAFETQRQILLSNCKLLIGTPETVPVLKEAVNFCQKELPIIVCNTQYLPEGTVSFRELIEDSNVNHEVLREVRKDFNDVVLLPYSSGTTGLPKGVELTNRNIVANCIQQDDKNIRHYEETTKSSQDSVVAVLPFYHIYGLVIVMLHKLTVGCKVVTLPKFQPDTFTNALDQHRISLICAAPPLVLFLGSYHGVQPKHLDSAKRLTCGAAPLPLADVIKVKEKAKKMDILQVYGLTETSPLVSTLAPGSTKHSAGLPIPNTEFKIINSDSLHLGPNEVGELLIRGPQVMKGYRNNPEATKNCITEDGWFKSGDLAFLDEEGSLTIADRIKELIKVKGFQVAPAELESVIKEHPDVLDAGVIGVPDQRAGELPKAFIVLKEGLKTQPAEIANFVAERVAEYKRLKEIVYLDSLPKNPSGKLLRRLLKERYA